jgi:ABC-type uncharacterized transport system permease subunit
MNSKKKILVIAVNAILIAILFGSISLNKSIIRQSDLNTGLVNILSGCFPNFIAAYIISLAPVTAVILREIRYGRLIVYLVATAIFLILLVEEVNPMWGASEHYDVYDIIASGAGSILAVVTFELLWSSRKNRRSVFSHE